MDFVNRHFGELIQRVLGLTAQPTLADVAGLCCVNPGLQST